MLRIIPDNVQLLVWHKYNLKIDTNIKIMITDILLMLVDFLEYVYY